MKKQRSVQIVLLVIISIGLLLLATQKIWVPLLVQRILSRETSSAPVQALAQKPVTLEDGRQCYTYSHDATPEEPYTVHEFLDIDIEGNIVNGTKQGTQQGPDMSNGYTGTIMGTVNGNLITDTFSYAIEGSHNREEEMYRTGLTGLEKLRYPLVDKDGILLPDTTKSFIPLRYARVECTGSN